MPQQLSRIYRDEPVNHSSSETQRQLDRQRASDINRNILTMSLASTVSMFWNNGKEGTDLSVITAEHVIRETWEITRIHLTGVQLRDGVGTHMMGRLIAKVEEKMQGRSLVYRRKGSHKTWKRLCAFLEDCGFQEDEDTSDRMVYELRGPYHRE